MSKDNEKEKLSKDELRIKAIELRLIKDRNSEYKKLNRIKADILETLMPFKNEKRLRILRATAALLGID